MARWPEIVDLNGLVWPYLDFSGLGGAPGVIPARGQVLGAGDFLVVPGEPGVETLAPEVDLVGTDLSETGPDRLVRSLENLAGALLRRLQTPRGYLPQHPTYGSGLQAFLGRPLDVPLAIQARLEVASVLRSDPRVVEVLSVAVLAGLDALSITAEVDTVLGRIALSGQVNP